LRKTRGDGDSGDQAEQDRPRKSPQYGAKDLAVTGAKREPDSKLFSPLRYGVANQAEKPHDREEDGQAAQQADDYRDLFCLRYALSEPGRERVIVG
jgi:hypothetical protein